MATTPLPQLDQMEKASVKLTDGSVWLCEIDSLGRLVPVRQLTPPSVPKSLVKKVPKAPISAEELEKAKAELSDKYTELDETLHKMRLKKHEEQLEEKAKAEKQDLPPISDSVFRAKLASIMTDNMFDRRIRGAKRGKLDMMRLFKGEAGATNLFQKKQERKNKKYNVVLLVDESGSMQGSKIKTASEVAIFLARSFEGLNINLAIVGFNKFIMVHKDFNEPVKDYNLLNKTITGNVYSESTGAGYNNDFDGLSKVYKMFAGKDGQNLVIMLSDGRPATYSTIDHYIERPEMFEEGLKEGSSSVVYKKDPMGKRHELWLNKECGLTTRERDEKTHIHALVNANKMLAPTIGIGIMSDCWQVPDHIREDSLEKLKPVILQQIKSKVRRG